MVTRRFRAEGIDLRLQYQYEQLLVERAESCIAP
jgi:hypothetical protein